MHNKQNEEQLIIFRVGPVVCSVVSRLVESIVDNQPLHRFPGQAGFILGVLHYRDHAVSIVNLFNKFDFPEPKVEPNRGCFMMGNTIYGTVGFWVDEVLEITTQYKMHQTNLPAYAGANVFDCALLWSDQIVLQTDLNCLFTMNESAPLQDWIQQDENNRTLEASSSASETTGQVAWKKAANEASTQEIHSLMSRGAQLSKMIKPLVDETPDSAPNVWNGEEEIITVSPLTEISETIPVIDSIDSFEDSSGQLGFNFQSHENKKVTPKLIVNTKKTAETRDKNTTLDAIAAQHGDVACTTLEENSEVMKRRITFKTERVNPHVEKIKKAKNKAESKIIATEGQMSSLAFEKISTMSGSSFLDTMPTAANQSKRDIADGKDKKQEYEVEPLNSNTSSSEVYDQFENDWDTLLFTSVMLDDERGGEKKVNQEELSVLNEDDSVAMIDDGFNDKVSFKQHEAVERVAKRIARKNEGNDATSTFRITASVLVCAAIVFVIQSYWLSPVAETIIVDVPSLQLLKERNEGEFIQKSISIETVADKIGDEFSMRSVAKE